MAEKSVAESSTNPSYERMQKIQYKREVENSIQQVSESTQKNQEEQKKQEPIDVEMEITTEQPKQSKVIEGEKDPWSNSATKTSNQDFDSLFF